VYDWDFIKNFMSTDYLSYLMAPNSINKIHYSQELGEHYHTNFVPITEASLHTINCFVMCWPTFTEPWVWTRERDAWGTRCPHCDGNGQGLTPAVVPYGIWKDAEERLPNHKFKDYGMACTYESVPEPKLPAAYYSGALTVHMKTYDGYGYSMLQSIACGRPVVIPRRFHKYRTANRYLIPFVTCYEVEWDGKSLADTIAYATGSLSRANHYAEACYKASKGLFDWDHEAFRVGEFLERLI
jgi:glycosyltransferase involved in cell wall biosynthesis